MPMIFSDFPDIARANQFADEVARAFGVVAAAYADVVEAADNTPSSGACVILQTVYRHVEGPVAVVTRTMDEREKRIESLAAQFGGVFAGT